MIAFVFIVTVVTTIFAFNYFRQQKINSLGDRATSFAIALGSEDFPKLLGNEKDLKNYSYAVLKEKLVKLQEQNKDTRFVYVMGLKNEDVFFYADSEDPTSPDYSPPGQIYSEATPVVKAVFTTKSIQTEVSTDRWGRWLSVMAPIIDYKTNKVSAIVGFDMAYQTYLTEIVLFSLLPISVGLIIMILLLTTFLYARNDEKIMKLRSEYFAIAAHDLRTPLTGIKFALSTVQKSLAKSGLAKQVETVQQISDTTENMLISVNELLDGSSLEKDSKQKILFSTVNIVELVKNQISNLDISVKEKNLKVIFQSPVELLIYGDPDKLHRVFANLVSNAIKYSKQNGVVKIVLKKQGDSVNISIKDNGIGIPQSEQNKVFDGYYRASNAKDFTVQGTGLGLYYVKNIINLHKGKIQLISVPEKGTEIIVNFPFNSNLK